MSDSPNSARQRILNTAADLFFREGYRAVGIDTIIERSGVAKMTLYRHFPSKNELINAYLQKTNEEFWTWVEQAIGEHPDAPREQLVAIFETLASMMADPAYCGCAFQHAAIEFPHLEHPAHQAAIQQRQGVRDRLRDLAEQAGARQPELLADQLLLLMDGMLMYAQMRGPGDLISPVVQAAIALIDTQLETPKETFPA
jgi:AcrR family transcriptional regulator